MLLPVKTVPTVRTERLLGIDVARAVAFAGMAFAHFAGASTPGDPGWLQALDNVADGRAAPLFCMLLGLGAGILSARGTPDRLVVRRGLVLLALGLAIWPVVDRVYLILPHYGVLLLLVPLFRRLPTGWLLPAAVALFLVPSAITALVDDHGMRLAEQPDRYLDLLDPWFLVRHLVWTGGYPLVGWAGFVLVGLYVARQRLGEPAVQRRLLVGGAAVAALQPLAAAALSATSGGRWPELLDGTAHSNRTAWYVVASGSAVAAIGLCLILVRRGTPAVALAPLGRLALSAYLLHLLLGIRVWEWRDTDAPSLASQMVAATAVVAVLGVGAALWARRLPRGPAEMVVRAVSG